MLVYSCISIVTGFHQKWPVLTRKQKVLKFWTNLLIVTSPWQWGIMCIPHCVHTFEWAAPLEERVEKQVENQDKGTQYIFFQIILYFRRLYMYIGCTWESNEYVMRSRGISQKWNMWDFQFSVLIEVLISRGTFCLQAESDQ